MSQPIQPVRPSLKKRLLRAFKIVFVIYLAAFAITSIFQRRMIYHPLVFTSASADQMGLKANLERWTNSSGQIIGWKRPSPVQPAGGQLLIMYGNGSFAIGCAQYADAIQPVARLCENYLSYGTYPECYPRNPLFTLI